MSTPREEAARWFIRMHRDAGARPGAADAAAWRRWMDADPRHAADFQARLCGQDPRALREFLQLTLLSDHRADLARCPVPVLVVQNPHDDFVPMAATRFLVDKLPDARLRLLDASGHCPHISHPHQVVRALRECLAA